MLIIQDHLPTAFMDKILLFFQNHRTTLIYVKLNVKLNEINATFPQ